MNQSNENKNDINNPANTFYPNQCHVMANFMQTPQNYTISADQFVAYQNPGLYNQAMMPGQIYNGTIQLPQGMLAFGQFPNMASTIPNSANNVMAPTTYSREENSTAVVSDTSEVDSGSSKRAAVMDYKPRVAGQWIEYKTDDGLLYYFDAITKNTQWEKPKEFEEKEKKNDKKFKAGQKRKALAKMQSKSDITGQDAVDAAKNGKEKIDDEREIMEKKRENKGEADIDSTFSMFSLLSHEECVDMFKALLREQGIAHDAEWAGILSDIIKDSRYSAIKTLGERKKIFAEYCQEQKKEREQQRKEEIERKMNDFYTMLKASGKVDLSTKFSEIESIFNDDDRFSALKYIEKRSLFSKFRDALCKEQKQLEKRLFEENAPLFRQLLENSDKVDYRSEWEDLKEHFIHEECVKNLKAMERLNIFGKHKAALQRKQRKEQEALREKCKAHEKAFRKLLFELTMKKTLFHSKSRWSEVSRLDQFICDDRYKCFLEDQSQKDVPQKIFERFCCDMEDKLADEKMQLKKFLRSKLRRVGVDDTVEELVAAFKEDRDLPKIKEDHLNVLFLEMIAKARFKKDRKRMR